MDYVTSVSKRLDEYRELETEIKALNEVIREKNRRLTKISNEVVTVKLRDLIDELSTLDDVIVSVDTCIGYYGVHSKEELRKLRENHSEGIALYDDDTMIINIVGTTLGSFAYQMYLRFNMDYIQTDGKTLYQHMSVKYKRYLGNVYTTYVVDKKIKSLILDIPVRYLVNTDNIDWHPADLFTKAVLNCADRSYNSRNQHVRSRARKNHVTEEENV